VLELLGDTADPMFFLSALDGWRVGDTFLAGSELQRYRILAIDGEASGVLAGHADAIWIVAPINELSACRHPIRTVGARLYLGGSRVS
jgi:hypothetical protein